MILISFKLKIRFRERTYVEVFVKKKIHQNESLKGRFDEFNFMSACFLLPLKVERSKPCRHVDWLCFCFCFAFASPFAAHMILTFQL